MNIQDHSTLSSLWLCWEVISINVLFYRPIYNFLYFFYVFDCCSIFQPSCSVLQTTHFPGTACLTTNVTLPEVSTWNLLNTNSQMESDVNGLMSLSKICISSHLLCFLLSSIHSFAHFQYSFIIFHLLSLSCAHKFPYTVGQSKPLPLLLLNHRLSWLTIITFPIHSIYHWILRHSVS